MSPFGGIKERSNKMVPIPLKNFFACSVLLCSSYLLWTIDLAFFRTPHPLGVGPIFPRQCCNAMYVHATQVYFLRRLVWWVTGVEGLPRVKILFKRKNIELSIDPFSPWSTRKLILSEKSMCVTSVRLFPFFFVKMPKLTHLFFPSLVAT